MEFKVRHVPSGSSAVLQEAMQAESAEALRARLLTAGSVVLELRRATLVVLRRRARFDVAWWCRELATLLRAGMTAVEAIETLAAGTHDDKRDRVHASLLRSLREGSSLSKAMRAAGVFPDVLVAGVTASERTSTLGEALRDYLRYDELVQRLRRQALSAAMYPALVIAFGAAISVFLLVYVVPRFSRLYGELHGTVSPATTVVLWVSRTVLDDWPIILLLVTAAVGAAAMAWRSGHRGLGIGRLLARLPAVGRALDDFRLATLYQSLAMMFRGGYTFEEALQVCGGLDLGVRFATATAQARRLIGQGKAASSAMATAGLTETTTQRLLAVGERIGAFDTVLQTIADRHAERFATFVERATRVVEPLLLLAVALAVGSLVVMMYMPIFDIAGGLGVGP